MDEDRRRLDESFRRELAERLKALEKTNEFLAGEIRDMKDSINKFQMDALELHYTLFGGPKADNVGLLERFRKVAMRDRWIIWIVAASIGFLGKLASPLYTKWISDWAFNSVSERYLREHSHPKITHYKIFRKADPDAD